MKGKVFLYTYYTCGLILALILWPCLMLHKRGRRRGLERLGIIGFKKEELNSSIIWAHAASLGELKGLEPLLNKLPKSEKILFTSISVTALDYAHSLPYFYETLLLPFDQPLFLNQIFRKYRFKIFIFAETEIWPALLNMLQGKNIPCLMLNGKILEGSFFWYKLFKPIFKPIISNLSLICLSNKVSMDRFAELGASRDVFHLTGNMKYAQSAFPDLDLNYFDYFSVKRNTLVLGSIRKGEEAYFLDVLKILSEKQQYWNILLAPRQLEEIKYFMEMFQDEGYDLKLLSDKVTINVTTDKHAFIVVDSIGQLAKLYYFADLVFIGGTLVPGFGGHNPIEAAVFAKPIVMGVHTENIEDLIQMDSGAFMKINSSAEIANILLDFRAENFSKYAHSAKKLQEQLGNSPDLVMKEVSNFIDLTI